MYNTKVFPSNTSYFFERMGAHPAEVNKFNRKLYRHTYVAPCSTFYMHVNLCSIFVLSYCC